MARGSPFPRTSRVADACDTAGPIGTRPYGQAFFPLEVLMVCRLRASILTIPLLLSCAPATLAGDCRREGAVRVFLVHDMTLAQAEPAAKTNLTMEQRHVIKEIVLKDVKPTKTTA